MLNIVCPLYCCSAAFGGSGSGGLEPPIYPTTFITLRGRLSRDVIPSDLNDVVALLRPQQSAHGYSSCCRHTFFAEELPNTEAPSLERIHHQIPIDSDRAEVVNAGTPKRVMNARIELVGLGVPVQPAEGGWAAMGD